VRTLLRWVSGDRELRRTWWSLVLLSALLTPASLITPLVERYLIDDVVLARRLEWLPRTIALYGGLWLLAVGGGIVSMALRTYVTEQIALRLRQRLFMHCGALSLAFSHRQHSGRTMALFVNDVPNVAGFFGATALDGLISLLSLTLGLAIMSGLNWQLTVVAGIVPLLAAGVAAVVTRPLRAASRRAQEAVAVLGERLHENLAGMREVVAFGRERSQGLQFTQTLRELLRARMRVTWIELGLNTGQSVLTLAITLTILGYGGYLVVQGQTSLGTLIAMQSLFARLLYPLQKLVGFVGATQKVLASSERIDDLLSQTPQVQEQLAARTPGHTAGAVAFEAVTFGYQPDQPVLHEVSFTAQPGELVALVGPSGAGKSTLTSLIARFYDPAAGRVLLDGVDVRDLTLTGLRGQIAIVFQDTFLFAETIGENIAFGREGASETAIVAAARAANAWEFIERLPDGLRTLVGERGVRLSEGQKQRLAIARALLRDPRILILDEPTSALDARAEHLLQSALDTLMRGRTTFVIAHRLATVRRADRILVLEHGRIVEQGTHSTLLERHGLYRELFDLQFGVGVERTNDALRALAV
jgi:ATP-binding cassette, subfamily B, bacterial MsbA